MAQSNLEVSNGALGKIGEKTIAALDSSTRSSTLCTNRVDICKRSLLRMHPWNFAIKRENVEPTWATITGAASDGSADDQVRITSASHGLANGDRVTIRDIVGTTEGNGTWIIADKTTNTFDLVDSDFQNTYTSGGEWTRAAKFDFIYSIALPSDCLRVLRVNDYKYSPDWRIESGRILIDDTLAEMKYIYDVTDYTTMPIDFYECLALYLAIDLCLPLTGNDERKAELKKEFVSALAKARHSDATEDPSEELSADDWINSRISSAGGGDRSYYGMHR